MEDTHIVRFNDNIPLQAGSHYDLTFYCKSSGNVENLRYFFAGREDLAAQGVTAGDGGGDRYIYLPTAMNGGATWTKITGDVYVEKADHHKDDVPAPQFFFAFNGNGGTVWVTGFSLTKRQ